MAADFFVLPTRELEGFGLVILESMACGTPVLGTPVGAIPELIGTFDRRLVFEDKDWQAMKNKMEEIVRKPGEFSIDPLECRQFVEKGYSWQKTAETFERKILTKFQQNG